MARVRANQIAHRVYALEELEWRALPSHSATSPNVELHKLLGSSNSSIARLI